MGFISMVVMGGLGNQLFQVFAAVSYFLDKKGSFKLLPVRVGQRHFYFDSILSGVKQYVDNNRAGLRVYKEPKFTYNNIPAKLNNVICDGYWQSHSYFKNHMEAILRITKMDVLKKEVNDEYKEKYDNELVTIHFRIGDYKLVEDYHRILNVSYYINALKVLLDKGVDIKKVLIFGEEKDEKDLIKRIDVLKRMYPNLEFEIVDYSIPDYKQMLIMSNCKYNIIANSTFSCWGGYLNMNEDRVVIYPKKWFGPALERNPAGHKNTSGLFLEDWICVSE